MINQEYVIENTEHVIDSPKNEGYIKRLTQYKKICDKSKKEVKSNELQ